MCVYFSDRLLWINAKDDFKICVVGYLPSKLKVIMGRFGQRRQVMMNCKFSLMIEQWCLEMMMIPFVHADVHTKICHSHVRMHLRYHTYIALVRIWTCDAVLAVTWEVGNDTEWLDKFSLSDLQQGRDLCVSTFELFLNRAQKNFPLCGVGLLTNNVLDFYKYFTWLEMRI